MNYNEFPKSMGNINYMPDFNVENETATNITATNLTAANTITTNNLNITGSVTGLPSTNLTPLTTNIFSSSGLSFPEGIAGFSNVEWGNIMIPLYNVNITNLQIYHTTNMSTSHVLNLWNSSGTLLGTASTSSETVGWNVSTAFTNPIALTAGQTYYISFSLRNNYIPLATNSFPLTYNTFTITNTCTSATAGTFPGTIGSFSGAFGLDVVFNYPLNPYTLNAIGTSPFSTGSTGTSSLSPTRMIWAICTPNTGSSTVTINTASSGIKSIVYNSKGQFTVTFTNPFNFLPCVNITIESNTSNTIPFIAYFGSLSKTSVQILTLQPNVQWVDVIFSLMIIGI